MAMLITRRRLQLAIFSLMPITHLLEPMPVLP